MKRTKTVLITGCSTGLGRACALELDRLGFRVFAGVRKDADAKSLEKESSGCIMPVIMDIVDEESVAQAVRKVEGAIGVSGLEGLVNNAGMGMTAPLECLPMAQFESLMRVNVSGHVRVTQAFLPLVRKAAGRIVFMGSESGRFTLPTVGAYSASKFALEAVANAFRAELLPWGIRVSIIEPASVQTEIWGKLEKEQEKFTENLSKEMRDLYQLELRAMTVFSDNLKKTAIQPARVTRAVLHALTARRPKARYPVGGEAWFFILMDTLLPRWTWAWVGSKTIRMVGRRG